MILPLPVNANIKQFTNWQSRTAMVVMPALFAFTFSSENRMVHRMKEVANETEASAAAIKSVRIRKSMVNVSP